jgi:signal transduction histidine kinase
MSMRPPSFDVSSWRESMLDLVLRVASYAIPAGVVVALTTLTRQGTPIDPVLACLMCVACVIVALRLLPRLGFAVRAASTVLVFQSIGTVVLVTVGPMPGATLGFATAAVLCAVLFSTRTMLGLLALTLLTFASSGWAVYDGLLVLRAADTNYMLPRNWGRAASTTLLMTVVLAVLVARIVGALEKGAGVLHTMYDQLSALHRRLDSAKEHGERKVSRELEAEVVQALAALKLRLQAWHKAGGHVAAGELADALSLADELIDRTRSLSLGLRPVLLDELGLEPALRALLDARALERKVDVNMKVTGLEGRLPSSVETACYRVVEHAIDYVLRDPRGLCLSVTLRRADEGLTIRVEHDGRGAATAWSVLEASESALAVADLRERVRMLGGDIEISASCIAVNLPLPQGLRADASS